MDFDIQLEYTAQIRDRFQETGIVETRNGKSRFGAGEYIVVGSLTEVGLPFGFYRGTRIPDMGFHSFSHSEIRKGMKVGNYCSIAEEVSLFGYQHPLDLLTTSPIGYEPKLPIFDIPKAESADLNVLKKVPGKQTVVENDVWLGRRSMLKGGITIGTGACVGTAAIVTKDVPPYAIVAGNPARIIRYRFPEEVIAQLLETEWWTYPAKLLAKLDWTQPIDKVLKELETFKDEPRLPPKIKAVELLGIDVAKLIDAAKAQTAKG
jgi:acetyltransferase-like isoleucine patch superfamily enzyme